jgi:CDP-6-deoxy-D-xylo-4-hexulose-3-dehydrase
MKLQDYYRQPVFMQLKPDRSQALRVVGEIIGADENMHQAIFLRTYPGLTEEMIQQEIETIGTFVRSR